VRGAINGRTRASGDEPGALLHVIDADHLAQALVLRVGIDAEDAARLQMIEVAPRASREFAIDLFSFEGVIKQEASHFCFDPASPPHE
jgi:hypothetical protein